MKKKIIGALFLVVLSILLIKTEPTSPLKNQLKTQTIIDLEDNKYSLLERYRFEIVDKDDDIIYMEPNETKELTLTLKNTGKSTWNLDANSENRLILGTKYGSKRDSYFYNKDSNKWANASEVYIEAENGKEIIAPNDTMTFKFDIKAPSSPGYYRENFTPLATNIKWLNNETITYDFVVEGDFSQSYSYEQIDKNLEATMPLKESKEINVELKNTGTVPWYKEDFFPAKLFADDRTAASLFLRYDENKVVAYMLEREVNPGETGTFVLTVDSPENIGSYEIDLNFGILDLYTIDYQSIILAINVSNKQVALTFDDGYGEIDPFIDALNKEGVKGTFFILGCVAQDRPEQMKRIVNEGHLLANHSYCHPDFRTLSADEIRWQLNETRTIMQDITGKDVYPYFRYPYGAKNSSTDAVVSAEGWKWFQWTNGTGDYQHHENSAEGRQQVYYYATLNPPEKAIILMHVISKSTLAVIPDIVQWYRDHDYAFVTVDELAE